jgi:hypothetical protein
VIYSSEKDTGHKHIKEFISRMQAVHSKYTRMLELSTSLRLICPVWAEAFINFLIFGLTRNEIKDDARLYQDFVRKEIDVRIKLLHINCVGFAKAIDTSDQRYKDFHSLMNDRNDLLHGNINPEKLSYETVYFDKMIPLFTEPQGLARNSLGVSLKGVEPATTLQHVQLVESFMEFILSHLDTPYKEEISLVLSKRELGWRSDTNKMGSRKNEIQRGKSSKTFSATPEWNEGSNFIAAVSSIFIQWLSFASISDSPSDIRYSPDFSSSVSNLNENMPSTPSTITAPVSGLFSFPTTMTRILPLLLSLLPTILAAPYATWAPMN